MGFYMVELVGLSMSNDWLRFIQCKCIWSIGEVNAMLLRRQRKQCPNNPSQDAKTSIH